MILLRGGIYVSQCVFTCTHYMRDGRACQHMKTILLSFERKKFINEVLARAAVIGYNGHYGKGTMM
jgi:hypothetical protein